MSRELLRFITDLGDTAVLAAVAFVAAAYFFMTRHPREALAMAMSFIVSAGAIAVLKLIFLTCGNNIMDIHSPSGHAAIAVSVLGTLGLIMTKALRGILRFILPVILFCLGVAIAVTREKLYMHSESEVILGIVIGILTIIVIARFILRRVIPVSKLDTVPGEGIRRKSRLNPLLLILILCVAGALAYGVKIPAERNMKAIAEYLQIYLPFCEAEQRSL